MTRRLSCYLLLHLRLRPLRRFHSAPAARRRSVVDVPLRGGRPSRCSLAMSFATPQSFGGRRAMQPLLRLRRPAPGTPPSPPPPTACTGRSRASCCRAATWAATSPPTAARSLDAGQFWYWYEAGAEGPAAHLAGALDGRPHLAHGAGARARHRPRQAWDERAVADPYVIRIGAYFYMYYLGQDRAGRQRLGVARSSDGIHWEKLRANPILEMDERRGRARRARRLAVARLLLDALHRPRSPRTATSAWPAPPTASTGPSCRAVFAARSLGLQGDLRPHRGGGRRRREGLVRRRRRRFARRESARPDRLCYAGQVNVGITCYPTYGGSGIVATELGMELAARGHEVHFITYANPIRLDPDMPRIHYHEVEVSNYPLFQYPPYCLALASRMAEVAESYKLDLLHVHYAIPHSISAMLAQQMLAPRAPPALHHHAARHRHHAGGRGPLLFPDHQVLHREIRRHHLHQRVPARADGGSLRRAERDPRDQQLRQLRPVPSGQRKEGRRGLRAGRREAADPPLEFPPGEARAGLHPHSGRGAQERAGASADGGRRSRARPRGAPGARA